MAPGEIGAGWASAARLSVVDGREMAPEGRARGFQVLPRAPRLRDPVGRIELRAGLARSEACDDAGKAAGDLQNGMSSSVISASS